MKLRWLLISVLFVWSHLVSALTAQVNRTLIEEGETLQLTLSVDPRNPSGTPDLSALHQDFDVLSTGREQEFRMINGKQSGSARWIINLAPKHKGKINIPAITVGSERSQAITIEVIAVNNTNHATPSKNLFIETIVTPPSPWVQSQMHYVSKFFYASEISEGALLPPKANNAVIKRLGEDIHYKTIRNNRSYQVIERHYAIFPQTSGTLTINGPEFRGQVAVTNDPASSFGRFLRDTIPARTHGPDSHVTVKAKPAEFNGKTWLPAEHLSLTASWLSDPKKWHEGEAATLLITMQAKGLTAAQLPEILLDDIENVNNYPDQAKLIDRETKNSITGIRRQRIALVPQKAGTITIPKIDIVWWNTNTAKRMHTSLPEQRFNIAVDLKHLAPSTSNELTPIVHNEHSTVVNNTVMQAPHSHFWPMLVSLVVIGWLITLFIWQWPRLKKAFLHQNTTSTNKTLSLNRLTHAVQQACESNQPTAVQQALLQWAQHRFPKKKIRTLSELIPIIPNEQQPCIKHLEKACYAVTENWDGQACWQSLQSVLKFKTTKKKKNQTNEPLKPLYPK